MKLRINHLTWTITGTDRSDQNLLGNDSEYTFGITYFDRTCAYIRTDLPEELIRRTVRHELTHMTLFSAGMIPESMDEEAICSFVESYGEEICDAVHCCTLHRKAKNLRRHFLPDSAERDLSACHGFDQSQAHDIISHRPQL